MSPPKVWELHQGSKSKKPNLYVRRMHSSVKFYKERMRHKHKIKLNHTYVVQCVEKLRDTHFSKPQLQEDTSMSLRPKCLIEPFRTSLWDICCATVTTRTPCSWILSQIERLPYFYIIADTDGETKERLLFLLIYASHMTWFIHNININGQSNDWCVRCCLFVY